LMPQFPAKQGYSPGLDPAYGGLFRKEAIMMLRRFYIQENEKGQSHDCYFEHTNILTK